MALPVMAPECVDRSPATCPFNMLATQLGGSMSALMVQPWRHQTGPHKKLLLFLRSAKHPSYSSKAWCLREYLFINRLRSFHNRCVRSMCRITMVHTMKHRITSKSLFERLGVGSFDSYYNRRLLR